VLKNSKCDSDSLEAENTQPWQATQSTPAMNFVNSREPSVVPCRFLGVGKIAGTCATRMNGATIRVNPSRRSIKSLQQSVQTATNPNQLSTGNAANGTSCFPDEISHTSTVPSALPAAKTIDGVEESHFDSVKSRTWYAFSRLTLWPDKAARHDCGAGSGVQNKRQQQNTNTEGGSRCRAIIQKRERAFAGSYTKA